MRSVSATSINTYNMCPQWWQWHYEFKLPQLPNDAFIVGTAYHKGLEQWGSGMAKDLIIDNAKRELIKNKTKEEIERFGLVRKLLTKFFDNPLEGDILHREYEFKTRVPNLPVSLFGYIDRVDVEKIIEYKTSSFDYKEKDMRNFQSKIYSYVVWKLLGKILPVHYSVNNKKKVNDDEYVPQDLSILYTKEELIDLEKDLIEFYNKVQDKKFEHKQGSHCYWCPYGSKGTNNCPYSL